MPDQPQFPALALDASYSIDLWSEANPRSVVNLVTTNIATRFREAQFLRPTLFDMDDQVLLRQLREEGMTINNTDHRLRFKFWMEYDECQSRMLPKLDMNRVVAAICTTSFLYDRYLKIPEKVAWLLTPPAGYAVKTVEALNYAIDQFRDILAEPHMVNGKMNVPLARLKLQIGALLDVRVHGKPIERTMNVHSIQASPQVAGQVERVQVPDSMESIEKKLKELKTRQKLLTNGGIIATTSPGQTLPAPRGSAVPEERPEQDEEA